MKEMVKKNTIEEETDKKEEWEVIKEQKKQR
jgi:hypothetical protein